jgi:YD repeat-containing protein
VAGKPRIVVGSSGVGTGLDTAKNKSDSKAKKTKKASGKKNKRGPKSKKNTPKCKDPIDVITGSMVYESTDFELPGPIPLVWNRNWYSDSSLIGHLGYSTRCSFEMGMDIPEDERSLYVYLADGRMATFPKLMPQEEYFNDQEELLLRHENDHYSLFDPESRYYYLFYPSENGYMRYKLHAICNQQGHRITVEYNDKGFLSKITDSVGRELDVTTNESGRITQVAHGTHVLVQYRYNTEQDLVEVIDAAGQSAYLKYINHLITQKIDRNKNSFYWKYDGQGPDARVIDAWGDGDVLAGRLEYDEGCTTLTDRQGNITEGHL